MMRSGPWMLAVLLCVSAGVGLQAGEPAAPVDPVLEPDVDATARVMPWNSVDEPWRLFPRVTPIRLDIHGWLNFGYSYNPDKPASDFNGVQVMNDRSDDIDVRQAYLVIERVADPTETGFDFGGRLDALWGYDARFTEPADSGLGTSWNSHEFWGYDLPQFYAEMAIGGRGLTFRQKCGRFYSPIGYDRIAAPANFFASNTYARVYGEPVTHFGSLSTLEVELPGGTTLTALGGFDRGWNCFRRHPLGNDTGVFGGGTFQTQWGTELLDTSVGYVYAKGKQTANPNLPGVKDDAHVHSVVFQQAVNVNQPLLQRILYVFQYDTGGQNRGDPYTFGDAKWEAQIHYVIVELSRVWSVGFRRERFQDKDGSRVGGIGRRRSGSPISPFGFQGTFTERAFGINCKPSANITLRAEARRDTFSGTSGFGPLPFDDGAKSNQTTYGLDCIILF